MKMNRLQWTVVGGGLVLALALIALIVVGPGQIYTGLAAGTANNASLLSEEATPPTATGTPTTTPTPTLTPSLTATPTPTVTPTITRTPTPTLSPTPLPTRVKVPILMYHYIRVNPDPTDLAGYGLSVTPKDFEAQVAYLTRNGYRTVSFEQLVAYFKNKRPLPPKPIILTFDDGYRDFYINAYPVLKKYGQTATVFLITGSMDRKEYLTSEQIIELAANGIEFGGHTATHQDVRWLGQATAAMEISASKRALEMLLGKRTIAFAYPSGGYDDWAISLLKAAGYQAAVTTVHGVWHREADLLSLTRVRVSGSTTLDFLARQIEGQ